MDLLPTKTKETGRIVCNFSKRLFASCTEVDWPSDKEIYKERIAV